MKFAEEAETIWQTRPGTVDFMIKLLQQPRTDVVFVLCVNGLTQCVVISRLD